MVTLSQFLVAERFSFEVSNVRLVEDLRTRNTLIPKNLCAIILSTIYLSPKNLGIKFELIWATENLGTNSSKNERFSAEPSVAYLP